MRAKANLLLDEYEISISKKSGAGTADVSANASSGTALIYGIGEIMKYAASRLGIPTTELLCRVTTTLLVEDKND